MLAEIRKCADKQDIKGLRYIFVDSLDVDPTFDTYREDYEYCKKIDGMFDTHKELTTLSNDKAKWTSGYWEHLKLDLMKNFSEKRFEHMISVAKTVYAGKIERLTIERNQKNKSVTGEPNIQPVHEYVNHKAVSEEQLQQQKIEEQRRAIEDENRKIEAEKRAQTERIEAARRAEQAKQSTQNRDRESKKMLGIVFAVIVVVVIIILILH